MRFTDWGSYAHAHPACYFCILIWLSFSMQCLFGIVYRPCSVSNVLYVFHIISYTNRNLFWFLVYIDGVYLKFANHSIQRFIDWEYYVRIIHHMVCIQHWILFLFVYFLMYCYSYFTKLCVKRLALCIEVVSRVMDDILVRSYKPELSL